jgi:hypothetical protein
LPGVGQPGHAEVLGSPLLPQARSTGHVSMRDPRDEVELAQVQPATQRLRRVRRMARASHQAPQHGASMCGLWRVGNPRRSHHAVGRGRESSRAASVDVRTVPPQEDGPGGRTRPAGKICKEAGVSVPSVLLYPVAKVRDRAKPVEDGLAAKAFLQRGCLTLGLIEQPPIVFQQEVSCSGPDCHATSLGLAIRRLRA